MGMVFVSVVQKLKSKTLMAGKTHRISKVAAELNVSWKSLIEYLNQNGYEVDMKMTAKIGQDMYDVLEQKYRSDKQAKEESQALEINIRRQDETLTANTNKPSSKKKKGEEEAQDIVLIKDTGLSRPNTTEEPVKEEKPEPVKETPEAKAKEEVPEVKEEKPEVKEEKPTTKKKDIPGFKVLGKISLDKPEKKKKEAPKEEEKPKEEKKATEEKEKVAEKPAEKKEVKK